MKATMKILKGYRAEDCIAMAIAHKGVSYKIFGEKGDCYQIPTSIWRMDFGICHICHYGQLHKLPDWTK